MVAPQVAEHPLATMEAAFHAREESDEARLDGKACLDICDKPTRCLVEFEGIAHESGHSKEIL